MSFVSGGPIILCKTETKWTMFENFPSVGIDKIFTHPKIRQKTCSKKRGRQWTVPSHFKGTQNCPSRRTAVQLSKELNGLIMTRAFRNC